MNKTLLSLAIFFHLLGSVAFAAPDYNAPTLASTKTGFVSEVKDNIADVAKMDLTTAANVPSGTALGSTGTPALVPGALRYNRTSDMLEEYVSSVWTEVGIGPVGTIIARFSTTAPTGYLILQGGTIGAAASGATARAHVDALPLFVHLYTNLANAEAPVSGAGRTGSDSVAATNDFNAGKTLTLPNMSQKFPMGKATSGTGVTLGSTGGAINHAHITKAHYHGMEANSTAAVDIAHTHTAVNITGTVGGGDGGHSHTTSTTGNTVNFTSTDNASTGITGTSHNTSNNTVRGWANNTGFGNQDYAARPNGTGGSANNTGMMTDSGHSHTISDPNHNHSINDPGHGHTVTVNPTNSGHGHGFSLSADLGATSKSVTGNIGLITGGQNGNLTTITTGDVSGAAVNSNPPFLTMNYFIKY